MKFVRFGARGAERPGVVDPEGGLRDLSGLCGELAGSVLVDLRRFAALDIATLPKVDGSPRLGACVGGTGKFMCIGLNYADHAAEGGLEVPSEPVLFMKATSAMCGPTDPIIIPRGSSRIDWEVELGVVIGKPAKYVTEAEAMDHVAGYCVVNDVSERDFQMRRAGQWTKGKSCDNFGPVGPWLVTPDEVEDPQALGLWLSVNGEKVQSGTTARMIFGVRFLISYLSQFMTLHPGDIISTGTPAGVGDGFRPQRYLKPGDVVELGIDGMGQQRQTVIADHSVA